MSIAIKIDSVSKQYRLGEIGTGSLAHDVNRWWHRVRGKEDPYLKVGETNDRSKRGNSEYAWALKDVSFEIQQGEILGIIGRNGAGKSTLLKILSRVTSPTTGSVRARGRIASLLEVGTGFHPELTGRENIYLNGAILGMKRQEITKRFDDIVDFSGCAKYVDTPVKRYSSGMTVRLGFAVAAHLECEILIVDEVLSVGDAEFQRKSLGKLRDVSSRGRTVLFVSHNMPAIQSLCHRTVVMDHGCIVDDGETSPVVRRYLSAAASYVEHDLADRTDRTGDGSVRITAITVESATKGKLITSTCSLKITVEYASKLPVSAAKIMIGIYDENDTGLYGLDTSLSGDLPPTLPQKGAVCCITSPINLTAGKCSLNVAFFANGLLADHIVNTCSVLIEPADFFKNGRTVDRSWMLGLLHHNWHLEQD